jgi:hypothetical protein
VFLVTALLAVSQRGWSADAPPTNAPPTKDFELSAPSLWQGGGSNLFQRGTSELSFALGIGVGMPIFGSRNHHNWALGMVEYGMVVSDIVAKDHWCRGNWELVANVFGGFQYSPDTAYLAGVAPMLRYNFATGTRWVPFFGLGAGVAATDIRDGDLSTTFEFNLQAGAGVRVFLKENAALTLQYRFMHLSNDGMESPNQGVNSSTFLVGMTWLF